MVEVTSIPVSAATLVKADMVDIKKDDPERWAKFQEIIEKLTTPMSQAEREARIAEQRAMKVHTVYSLGDKIIGMHWFNGWSTFASSGDGQVQGHTESTDGTRVVSGDVFNKLIADQTASALRQKYGAALRIDVYTDASTAPTAGEIQDLMFGRTHEDGASIPVRTGFNAQSLELLYGARRS